MIEKTIHYCWFGGGPLNELSEKCIASWKKICPDYKIVRWDESNYDVTKNRYMREAYEAKKWGFVPDYARLDILYEHGGIYLDTDVELLRPLDELLDQEAFMGFECTMGVNIGQGSGAVPRHPTIKLLRDFYDEKSFLREDGTLNLDPCLAYQMPVLKSLGLKVENKLQHVDGVTIYPTEVLSPYNWYYGTLKITPKTVSIHHYAGTWHTPEERAIRQRELKLFKMVGKHLGRLIISTRNTVMLLNTVGPKETWKRARKKFGWEKAKLTESR